MEMNKNCVMNVTQLATDCRHRFITNLVLKRFMILITSHNRDKNEKIKRKVQCHNITNASPVEHRCGESLCA